MIAVIFEVWMKSERRDEYLDIASQLKTELANIAGFISVERFESISAPGKLLSLSFWRDEQAVSAWRKLEAHRVAQIKGRGYIFAGYRLRVASILRDYGMSARKEAPCDSKAVHGQGDAACSPATKPNTDARENRGK